MGAIFKYAAKLRKPLNVSSIRRLMGDLLIIYFQLSGSYKTHFQNGGHIIQYDDIMPLIWVFPRHIHLHPSCIHVSRLGMSLGILVHGFDKIYGNILISYCNITMLLCWIISTNICSKLKGQHKTITFGCDTSLVSTLPPCSINLLTFLVTLSP